MIPGLVAGADLSSNQFRAVRLDATAPFVVATISDANAPQIPIGIQQSAPSSTYRGGIEVAGPGEVCKAEAGGSFNEAVALGVDDNGCVIEAPFETSPASADLYIIGTSLQVSGGSGQVVYILVQSPVLASTE